MFGYYAEPPDLGYYAEPDDFGFFAEDEWDGYSEPDDYGWYGEDDFYGEEPELVGWGPLGYYAEEDEFADYADDIGACPMCGAPAGFGEIYEDDMGYAEDDDYGWYGEADDYGWYGEEDDYGWVGEDDDYGWYGEEDDYGWVGDDDLEGYVKEVSPSFNPHVVAATNLSGFGEYREDDEFGAYVKPRTVNASCGKFVAQPGSGPPVPDTLRPLW